MMFDGGDASRTEKKFYFDLLKLVREMRRDDLLRDLRYARFKSRALAAIRGRLLGRSKRRARN